MPRFVLELRCAVKLDAAPHHDIAEQYVRANRSCCPGGDEELRPDGPRNLRHQVFHRSRRTVVR